MDEAKTPAPKTPREKGAEATERLIKLGAPRIRRLAGAMHRASLNAPSSARLNRQDVQLVCGLLNAMADEIDRVASDDD